VTLQAGSMGPEEHQRRRSTVAGEAEKAVAGDELAESYTGRGRWGSGSPVRTMTGGQEGW
jgi:hypothetical protein